VTRSVVELIDSVFIKSAACGSKNISQSKFVTRTGLE